MKAENTVEFCSGTKSFSKAAKLLGHNTFTVDIDRKLNPDLCIDIMDFDLSMLPYQKIDRAWFSPPCTTFSVASIRHYWTDGKPKNEKCLHGIALVKRCLDIAKQIKAVNPDCKIYIENPRGMLRKQDFMQNLPYVRRTVTYCQYGDDKQKPTDIWTDDLDWNPKPMCKRGSGCHNSAKRGSDTGTQGRGGGGKYGWLSRTTIPSALFAEIFNVTTSTEVLEAEALRTPPTPKDVGIRAGDLL